MDHLGGYRLVRLIGAGTNADVWLGHDGSSSVAVKVYRPEAELPRIDAEVEALGRISHRHVLRLDDLVVGPTGAPSLILPRLSTARLSWLMASRTLDLGEVVTVLAPIASAVASLHHAGVAHRRISASRILFDESGAPVLIGFGDAELFAEFPDRPDAATPSRELLRQHAGVGEDVSCLAGLCRLALGGRGGARMVEWLESASERDPAMFTVELSERLFDLATPVPLNIEGLSTATARSDRRNSSSNIVDSSLLRPAHSIGDAAIDEHNVGHITGNVVGLRVEPSSTLGLTSMLPEQVVQAMRDVFAKISALVGAEGLGTIRHRLVAALRQVRKGVWIFAAAAVVGVVTITALIPQNVESHEPTGHGDSSPPPLAQSAQTPSTAIVGDDPVAAGGALLAAREQCITAKSVLCLNGVDQSGSASMQADSDTIRILQQSGAEAGSSDASAELVGSQPETVSLTLVESLGDSVLLSVALPTDEGLPRTGTLLLVHGPEGWRIRDSSPVALPAD